MSAEPSSPNHAKYTVGAQNPVVRLLMDQLFARVDGVLSGLEAESLLDVGCGEGHALGRLADRLPSRVAGVDMSPEAVAYCQRTHPGGTFSVGSAYELPFEDRSFDVVLCMEVLEHLDRPADGLAELVRVCRSDLVLSVPFEPFFQLGNLVRGQWRETWGNQPEHVQHWGRRSFPRFLRRSGLLRDVRVGVAGTWLVAHARPGAP